jgi:hypothetical protein
MDADGCEAQLSWSFRQHPASQEQVHDKYHLVQVAGPSHTATLLTLLVPEKQLAPRTQLFPQTQLVSLTHLAHQD